MLGDLIYEAKGKVIAQRILAVAPQTKIENTVLLDGIMHGVINITDTGTFINSATGDGVYYNQGQGIITTKDRRDMAVWTAQGIQQHNITDENNNNSLFRGSAFYYTASKGKLAFLNNIMTVFKSEVDNAGNILNKEWEWK
jgi:hypothetical protein